MKMREIDIGGDICDRLGDQLGIGPGCPAQQAQPQPPLDDQGIAVRKKSQAIGMRKSARYNFNLDPGFFCGG